MWDELLDDFSSYIGSEKGLSLHTIEAYQRDITAFFNFLRKANLSTISDVEETHLMDFIELLKADGYASSSIARNVIAIKVLCRFLKRERTLPSNFALYINTPKIWQLIPEVLSCTEMVSLLEAPDKDTLIGSRDKAILEVLYACGLRVSELCSLKIYDVDDVYVRVLGKGMEEASSP